MNPTRNVLPLAAAVILFCLSIAAIIQGSLAIPIVSLLSLFGLVVFFKHPRTSFAVILGIRIVLDLLWWLPIKIGPLNMLAAFTGGATVLGTMYFFIKFRQRIQTHPCIHLFLLFTLLVGFGAIRSLNTTIMFDEFLRLYSPPLMLFIGTALMHRKGDARRFLLFLTLIGLAPILSSLYHLIDGQMTSKE